MQEGRSWLIGVAILEYLSVNQKKKNNLFCENVL